MIHKRNYMKKGELLIYSFLLLTLSSCEFDDKGDLYITDTGWFVLIAFIVAFIFGLVKADTEKKKEEDFNAYVDEYEKREALRKKEAEEARRLKQESLFKSIAEEYKDYSSMDIDVKGIYYRTKLAKETVPDLTADSVIKLRKEPSNEYDPCAVKVMYERIHLGYVPASVSEKITTLIDGKAIKKIVVKYAGDARLETWDDPDPYLTLTIYYDGSFYYEQ